MDNSVELSKCLLSNFCNLIPIHLDKSNYVTWKFLVETLLKGCGLMRYIDGSFPCPPEYMNMEENEVASDMTKEYMNWVQNDSAVMSILAATLSNDALSFIIGSKSSKEIWCRLKEKYVDDSRYNILNLKTSLYNIQKGSDCIDKYLLRVKSICDQLLVVGVDMADEDIIEYVLHGLSSEFAVIKTIIRIRTLSSSLSMKECRSLLLIAEDEINQSVMSMSLSIKSAMAAFGDTSRTQATSAAHVSNDLMFTKRVQEEEAKIGSFVVKENSTYGAHLGSPCSRHEFQTACQHSPLVNSCTTVSQGPYIMYNTPSAVGGVNSSSGGSRANVPQQQSSNNMPLASTFMSQYNNGNGAYSQYPNAQQTNGCNGSYTQQLVSKRDEQKTQASVPVVDVRVSAPITSSRLATSLQHPVTSAPVTSASFAKQEPKPFDEFDLRGSALGVPFGYVSAAPATSNNAAMDLLSSLLLTIVPNTSTTTTSEVGGLVHSAPDTTMLNCKHASHLKLRHLLPLIPPG